MKRLWIFNIVLLTIISLTFASVKVNAAEIGKEYVYKSEEGIVYITLIDETNAKIYSEIYEIGLKAEMTGIYKISQEVENAIDFYAVSEINGEIIYDYWNTFILNEDGTAKEYVEVDNTPTTDDNTQKEVDKVPTIIEEKAKEFTDWIIALVVSFLGSSAFYLIVKAILNKTIKILKDKIAVLTKSKDESEESKKEYEKKIDGLENTINKLIENNDVLLNFVREKLEVDAAKEQKMAELLSTLLPKEGAKND